MPLITNPANAGSSEEGLRFSTGYRNQWASIGNPFNTFYVSLDKRLIISEQMFGIGASVIHDMSAGNRLTADKVNFSLSYSLFYNNSQFVFGVQPGFVFRRLSHGLTFGSQFDPVGQIYNEDLPNFESSFSNNNYFDLNAGFLWKANIKSLVPSTGISISHINRPSESLMNNSDSASLPLKYTFHGNIGIPVTSWFEFTPCYLFGYTPGAREFVAGGIAGFKQNSIESIKKIYAMNLYRINPARNIDAIIIGGGIRFTKFDLGISYDINVSSLRKATNFRGAFEVTLVFLNGSPRPKKFIEPCSIF
jgi:type IX secretion system PorP/SprF family membrane protein